MRRAVLNLTNSQRNSMKFYCEAIACSVHRAKSDGNNAAERAHFTNLFIFIRSSFFPPHCSSSTLLDFITLTQRSGLNCTYYRIFHKTVYLNIRSINVNFMKKRKSRLILSGRAFIIFRMEADGVCYAPAITQSYNVVCTTYKLKGDTGNYQQQADK